MAGLGAGQRFGRSACVDQARRLGEPAPIGCQAVLERDRQECPAIAVRAVPMAGCRPQVGEVGLAFTNCLAQQPPKRCRRNQIPEPQAVKELIPYRRGASRGTGEPPTEGGLPGSGDREELPGGSRPIDFDATLYETALRKLVEDSIDLPEMERGKAEGRGGEQATEAIAVYPGVCGDMAENQIGDLGQCPIGG